MRSSRARWTSRLRKIALGCIKDILRRGKVDVCDVGCHAPRPLRSATRLRVRPQPRFARCPPQPSGQQRLATRARLADARTLDGFFYEKIVRTRVRHLVSLNLGSEDDLRLVFRRRILAGEEPGLQIEREPIPFPARRLIAPLLRAEPLASVNRRNTALSRQRLARQSLQARTEVVQQMFFLLSPLLYRKARYPGDCRDDNHHQVDHACLLPFRADRRSRPARRPPPGASGEVLTRLSEPTGSSPDQVSPARMSQSAK